MVQVGEEEGIIDVGPVIGVDFLMRRVGRNVDLHRYTVLLRVTSYVSFQYTLKTFSKTFSLLVCGKRKRRGKRTTTGPYTWTTYLETVSRTSYFTGIPTCLFFYSDPEITVSPRRGSNRWKENQTKIFFYIYIEQIRVYKTQKDDKQRFSLRLTRYSEDRDNVKI